jgi:DNA polymerase eta
LAVNYPARKFGIGRFQTIQEAKKLCPELVVQHVPTISSSSTDSAAQGNPGYYENPNINTHKASLVTYREASFKIMAIISSHFPKSFQKASVDEAFIDCSHKVKELILKEHGDLINQREELPLVDWTKLHDSTFLFHLPEEMEVNETSDSKVNDKNCLQQTKGWKDLFLFYAARISLEIRTEIYEKLGYTSSTGIAHNKTLAKLISSTNKPNKQTVLLDVDVMDYMKMTKLSKIRGLGGKLGDIVCGEFGCEMASDLWKFSLEKLVSIIGQQDGKWAFDICRGICHDLVKESALTKSMQSCKNFRKGIQDMNTLNHWLRNLSSELYHRLFQDFEENQRWPKSVAVTLRYKGSSSSVTKQSSLPHRDYVNTQDDLFSIIEAIVSGFTLSLPCFYIGIALSGLKKVDAKSTLINSYFKPIPQPSSSAVDTLKENIEQVCDLVDVESVTEERIPIDDQEVTTQSRSVIKDFLKIIDEDTGLPLFYKCLECGDVFEKRKQMEHADYHFAASLARLGNRKMTRIFGNTSKKKRRL